MNVGFKILRNVPVSRGITAMAPELNNAITKASFFVHSKFEILRFCLPCLFDGGQSFGFTREAV